MNRGLRMKATMAALIGGAWLLGGCGTALTSDTSLLDLLNGLTQTVSADPDLSGLTIGDIVQGFAQYAGGLAGGRGGRFARLTEAQQAQLEALQAQLDSGAIMPEQFAQQVHELIGDLAPRHAFAGLGMMGGPLPCRHGPDLAEQLQLTDEQRQQAEEILAALHADIETLRADAQQQIRALLTAEQLATLDEWQMQPPRRPGRHMGPPPPGGPGDPWTPLTDALGLTAEQAAAIDQIHADLRDAVAARHQQARDEFRAILTEEQLALLDELEAEHDQP